MQDGFDPAVPLVVDDFSSVPPTDGWCRTIRDVEGVISVRDGTLRISPLSRPGWNRAAVHYGPFQRRDGFALAVGLLNGHNGSEPFRQTALLRQVRRWAIGSGINSLPTRLVRAPFRLKRESLFRRLECWTRARSATVSAAELGGNLGIGWFEEAASATPAAGGDMFIVQGAGVWNGRILVRAAGRPMPVVERVPNIPIAYVVILRAQGAAYYLAMASADGDAGYLRPVAVDAEEKTGRVRAGLEQSVLGEIGFSADTIVYGVRLAQLDRFGQWYGTAHAADRPVGGLPLAGTFASRGGAWHALGDGSLVLRPAEPSGLIHLVVRAERPGRIAIVWRGWNGAGGARLMLDGAGTRLEISGEAGAGLERCDSSFALVPGRRHAIQVTDDGTVVRVACDGRCLDALTLRQAAPDTATEVGLADFTGGVAVEAFETHPRRIPWPSALKIDLPAVPQGNEVVIHEEFRSSGDDLSGYRGCGGTIWTHLVGKGSIGITPTGAQMLASDEKPAAGRLFYGTDWPDQGYADVTAVIVPPELKPGRGANSRGGIVFWEDEKNYVVVNLWLNGGDTSMPEIYGSVSCFFYLNGFEDVYDAVWTNVGDDLRHGRPAELRVACDGARIMAWLDGRPVLFRALTDVYPTARPLRIGRVGLGVNWEWGVDTGSRFTSFTARRR